MEIVPLILCGGEGSRLWPLTNEITPKHLLYIPDGNTFFEETLARAAALANATAQSQHIIIATNEQFYDAVFEKSVGFSSMGLLDNLHYEFLVEPHVRDTAPAIAIAALSLIKAGKGDVVLAIMPADHKIIGDNKFQETLLEAAEQANQGKLVSVGVKPKFANTAFGYLEVDDGLVVKFTEKPNLDLATQYFASGRHFWNSGIFCCKAKTLLGLLQKNCPLLVEQCQSSLKKSEKRKVEQNYVVKIEASEFEKIEAKSIDHQLLETLCDSRCIEATFDWCDVGSWDAYCDLFDKDERGNSNAAFGFSESSSNCSAFTSQKPIAILGLKDVVVVNTEEAILVANKNHSQNVRHLAMKLSKQANGNVITKQATQSVSENIAHEEFRSWGKFEILMERKGYKVKRLIIDPFQTLNLQSHKFRREHWLVVEGNAVATLNKKQFILESNEHLDIPIGVKHRISNPSHKRLIIIETQTGTNLEDEDEIRYGDFYGRADKED